MDPSCLITPTQSEPEPEGGQQPLRCRRIHYIFIIMRTIYFGHASLVNIISAFYYSQITNGDSKTRLVRYFGFLDFLSGSYVYYEILMYVSFDIN